METCDQVKINCFSTQSFVMILNSLKHFCSEENEQEKKVVSLFLINPLDLLVHTVLECFT